MKTIKTETFDALMAAVDGELRKGKIIEARIDASDGEVLDGMVDERGTVYIDPQPATLETVIHELLHRAKPRWGEKRICHTAHRLVMAMSDQERRIWFRRYQRVVTHRARPVSFE